jgi:1,4-alpha-glucan branching enzyme
MLKLIKNDPWLSPYSHAIEGRHNYAVWRENQLTGGKCKLSDFAQGHKYYGLHKEDKGWVFREWAPNATDIFLVGDFNDWQEQDAYRLQRLNDNGDWEVHMPYNLLKHGQHYKMRVKWDGGQGDRIPAWCQRVVQDHGTKIFSAQVWDPKNDFKFKTNKRFKPNRSPLLIYECHVGMAQEKESVGTYVEFREKILPRVKEAGYNCIQVMAIQEHPYYGSFGYHVSNFFAPSSRFGTPEELKELIDAAHGMGISVIMDLVHSHAVKNENEGLGNLAGDPNQYFLAGDRREHSAWDSLCFDYGKYQVLHFLLSNCHYFFCGCFAQHHDKGGGCHKGNHQYGREQGGDYERFFTDAFSELT